LIFLSGTYEIVTLASTVPQQSSQTTQTTAANDNTPNSQVQTQANSSVHAVTQAAVKLGVLSCLKRIDQVATFLTSGNTSGIFIFTPQTPPDQHVFSTSFELIRPNKSTLYASASFFPNNDAVYDIVEYVEMSCEDVQKTIFKDLKHKSVLKNNIILLDGGAVKVFLMPAGSGTVVIKKEVVK